MVKRWSKVHGHTHSLNAREAEARGEMPLSRAIEAVYVSLECKKHKVPRRVVREFLEQYCDRGWHHIAGPNGVREVRYYATALTDEQQHQLCWARSRNRRNPQSETLVGCDLRRIGSGPKFKGQEPDCLSRPRRLAAAPKFETKRHGTSGHSNDSMAVPLSGDAASHIAGAALKLHPDISSLSESLRQERQGIP